MDRSKPPLIQNALGLSHELVEKALVQGDRAVDATCGNGHDTLFLARLVGPSGQVTGFDIQPAAIDQTRQRLEAAGLMDRCVLHRQSHDRMAEWVGYGIAAVMFNLGWLPGGDHRLGTLAKTTLPALEAACDLIRPGGIVTICIYYGRESGFAERDSVLEWVRALDTNRYAVQQTVMPNAIDAPIFIAIEKLT